MARNKQSRKHEEALIEANSYTSGFYQVANRFAAVAIANKLSGTEWAVWSYLCMSHPYADKTKSGERKYKSIPSCDQIGEEVGRSTKAVVKAMKRLEELGLYLFRYELREGYNITAEAAKTNLAPVVVETGAELNNSRIKQFQPELNNSSRISYSSPELFNSNRELEALLRIPSVSPHTISYSNQTNSHSFVDLENRTISSTDDSLRSTSELASEEEESSTKLNLDLIPKSLVFTEEQSNTGAYSSSLKIKDSTTANSLRGKQEEDLRSLRILKGEVNKIGAKSASNRAEMPQSTSRSFENALQAPVLGLDDESYFARVLDGIMPQEAWDYGEVMWWGNLTDQQVRQRHEAVVQILQLKMHLNRLGVILTFESLQNIYMLGSDDLLWPALDASDTTTAANLIGEWFVVEGDEVVMYVGAAMKEPERAVVARIR